MNASANLFNIKMIDLYIFIEQCQQFSKDLDIICEVVQNNEKAQDSKSIKKITEELEMYNI